MKKRYMLSTFLLAAMLTACTGKSPEVPSQIAAVAVETESKEQRTSTETEKVPESTESEDGVPNDEKTMKILVQGNGHTVVFKLNDSPASRSLYNQLPLNIEVENYSSNEKIFYPPDKLEIGETPLTDGGGEGGLAYFASWGDVVMFYGKYGPYSGLYELGTAVSGSEWIQELSGEILISADSEAD